MDKVRIKLAPNGDVYRQESPNNWILLTDWDENDDSTKGLHIEHGTLLTDEEVMTFPTWCMPARGKGVYRESCHCGEPIRIQADGFTRGLCANCDDVRCDAYPGVCE